MSYYLYIPLCWLRSLGLIHMEIRKNKEKRKRKRIVWYSREDSGFEIKTGFGDSSLLSCVTVGISPLYFSFLICKMRITIIWVLPPLYNVTY